MRKRKLKDPSKKILLDIKNNLYSINLTREFGFIRYKDTYKACLYKNSSYRDNTTSKKSKPVYCKYPLYSLTVVLFNNTHHYDDILHFTDLKYNGKFFTFVNHLQDSIKYLKYVHKYDESKLTSRLINEKRKILTRRNFAKVGHVVHRLLYENGSGIFNFLYGDLDDFLTVLPKYEFRNILKVIRSDYYRLMKSRK